MPRKKPSLAQFSWDATPERLAKAANDNEFVHDKEANGAPVQRRRVTDWPLARLRARGLLDADRRVNEILYDAGERFQADWHAAGLSPLGAIDYGREHVDGGALGGLNVSEFRLAALERYRRAAACMGSSAAVVEAVACRGETIFEAANDNSLSNATIYRRGTAALRLGLWALAERYGLLKPHHVVAA